MLAGWTSIETLGLRVGESHVLGHTVVSEQSTRTGVLLECSIPVYFFGPLLEPFYSHWWQHYCKSTKETHCESIGLMPGTLCLTAQEL